jgi:hypothetical protein
MALDGTIGALLQRNAYGEQLPNIASVDAEFAQKMRRTCAGPLHAHAALVEAEL